MHHPSRGILDRRVLAQAQFWVTAEPAVLRLSEMSSTHLIAVLKFLHERHATRLHFAAILDALADLTDATATGPATAEMLTHQLTGESIATVDEHVWLEATPLVRAIRRELGERE